MALPIRKLMTQPALSDFEEYTMLSPGPFAKYVGFTEAEVRGLCAEYGVSFSGMKRWYDGYELRRVGSAYNPNSVMKALRSGTFDSYWAQTSAAVAAQIARIHQETTNPLNANREDSLRAVIQVAYFAYKDYYIKLEELPTGRGCADIVYLLKPGKGVPALLIELKWNGSADGAIQQIKDKNYPAVPAEWGSELLLVGISYDKTSREYSCRIEMWPDCAV